MHAMAIIRRLHEHRIWANHQLLEAVRFLSVEQQHRPLAIGQGSVWKTLTHLVGAEYVWLEALSGNASPAMPGDLPEKLPGNQQGEGGFRSLEQLACQWHELDRRWEAYLSQLGEEALQDTVYKVSTSSGAGRPHGTRCGDVLMHVCLHAHYTSAQLVNMLRQLGVSSLPDIMLISLARQETARQRDG
jgi:uncharacterized damage-inducible protein DinB